jgi:hypothetical protein
MPLIWMPDGSVFAMLAIRCARTWGRSGSSMSSGSAGSFFGTFGSLLPLRPPRLYCMWHDVQPDERKSPARLFAPALPRWQSPHVNATCSW